MRCADPVVRASASQCRRRRSVSRCLGSSVRFNIAYRLRRYGCDVTHSHSHALSRSPAPLGPTTAKVVVGLLVAIGVAVVIGAVLLWPSQRKIDVPLPFQNATGGAVTTEAG